MIEQKEAVIPSEVDPFVHERINAVEGPAVSAPKCDRSSRGNFAAGKAGSSTRRWIVFANPSAWSE